MGSERDTDRDLYFTTETADQCFLDEFVTGLGAVVTGEISTAAEMYNDIGALWYSVEKMIAGLKGADAHEPTEESSLVEDVRFAVGGGWAP